MHAKTESKIDNNKSASDKKVSKKDELFKLDLPKDANFKDVLDGFLKIDNGKNKKEDFETGILEIINNDEKD